MEHMEKQMDYQSSIRMVQTEAYLTNMSELIAQGHEVTVTVTGNSMAPFLIHGRDKVYFGPIRKPLKRGDIVFYKRTNGQFVMHRICNIRKGSEYYLIGDAQKQVEGPIFREQIFAIVLSVCRKGKWIHSTSLLWKFFQYVWIRVIPFRKMILKGYCFVQKRRNYRI